MPHNFIEASSISVSFQNQTQSLWRGFFRLAYMLAAR